MTPAGTRTGIRACVVAALLAGGCSGNRDVWDGYRAERMLWHARRLDDLAVAVGSEPAGIAGQRAAAALEAVVAAFPATTWATPATLARPRAWPVAQLSGTAALLRAEQERRAGRDAAAEQRFDAVAADYAAVDSVAVAARAERAWALERLGRIDEAIAAWTELDDRGGEPDSARVAPWSVRRCAPLETVRLLRDNGRAAAADSLGESAAVRRADAATRLSGGPFAGELWDTVSDLQRGARHWDEARAARRAALAEPKAEAGRADRVLELARLSREAQQPDTARVYARWAASEFEDPVATEAVLLIGHSWEDQGVADSALAVYKGLIEQLPPIGSQTAHTRFDRARLLERIGRWDEARAEFRALATMQPTHPCGEAALIEIVRHHAREGETVFATVETKHAMDTFAQLLATQGDPGVRLETQMARAEVLVLSDRVPEAERGYADAWHEHSGDPIAARAGWSAARLADSALRDTTRARALYQELSAGAVDLELRARARRRLTAPATAGGRP